MYASHKNRREGGRLERKESRSSTRNNSVEKFEISTGNWMKGETGMIDFSLTDEQRMLQDTAKKFSDEVIRPNAAKYDESGEFPRDILQQAFDIGLLNVSIPEVAGGLGLGCTEVCLINKQLARGCAGFATSAGANTLAAIPIIIAGSEQQQKEYLGPLCDELSFAAFCLTEPGAGSDAGAVATTAKLEGDEYILNGTKCFITNGGVARLYTVFASTDKSQGHRGLSAFIVPRDTEGVSVGKVEHKMGQRASDTTEVIFEDVRIPKANLLMNEGDGFKLAMMTLDQARPGVAAISVGLARAALEYAAQYAVTREQFGQAIAFHQGITFMLANMLMKVELADTQTFKAAWMIDQKMRASVEAAVAKLYASDIAMEVTTDAVQIYGGYGYMIEYPVEKLMRDAKLLQIYEGTNQIQRLVVGKEMAKWLMT